MKNDFLTHSRASPRIKGGPLLRVDDCLSWRHPGGGCHALRAHLLRPPNLPGDRAAPPSLQLRCLVSDDVMNVRLWGHPGKRRRLFAENMRSSCLGGDIPTGKPVRPPPPGRIQLMLPTGFRTAWGVRGWSIAGLVPPPVPPAARFRAFPPCPRGSGMTTVERGARIGWGLRRSADR